MTFKKNIEREKILLRHWKIGATVRSASLLTDIPEGSIGYYYRKFNKNKKKYKLLNVEILQDPPRTDPRKATFAVMEIDAVRKKVVELMEKDEFGKARDLVQLILLYDDFLKRRYSLINNVDQQAYRQETDNILKNIINYYKTFREK